MPDLTQTVSPLGGSQATTSSGAASRPMIDQTVSSGGDKKYGEASGKPIIEQSINHSERGGMRLSESTRKMLANLDAHGTIADRPKADEPAPPADLAASAPAVTPAVPATPAVAPTTPQADAAKPAAPAAPVATDEHRERADRFEARNRELVAEVERIKTAKREPSARDKALDEAERGYLDDSIGSIRRLIATAIGADDPKHADVDAELRGLYKDLTAKELGVELDQAELARREATRTKHMLARDRRERAAPAPAAPAETEDAKQSVQHAALIAGHLTSQSDAFPLTMRLAERLHGQKPEAMILGVIRQGFATGEFDPKHPDDQLIKQAAQKIENHYQDLAKMFGEARPQPSTAVSPSPQDVKANQDTGRSQVAPTITNASASVAPATPPAVQQTAQKPKYKSEADRRMAIAKQHFKD